MSAFAICVRTDGSEELPTQEIEAMFDALNHRGVNGRKLVQRRGAALGHQHFWTTPEEVGEQQPLHDEASGIDVLLDGRIDNREELADGLGLARADLSRYSDAALTLQAFLAWDERCFERLLGPFAVVFFDARRRRIVCGRDALGDRGLFYHQTPTYTIVASEEQALLAHPGVASHLDNGTVARFFAIAAPRTGATFFEEVRALPPGHGMTVEGRRPRLWRYWRPEELRVRDRLSDEERIESFRDALAAAVRCRLRCIGRPSVLMSGGLDSTSVAALAARELPSTLRTISWVFDELKACDEREFIQPMVDAFGFEAGFIRADELWPLKHIGEWQMSGNSPQRGLYQHLVSRAWELVRDDGGQTVLDGVYGDQLYASADYWLRDLLGEGRFGEAAQRVFAEIANYQTGTHRRAWFRTAIRRVVSRRSSEPTSRRPWLTAHARKLIRTEPDLEEFWNRHQRPHVARCLLDPLWASATSVADADSAHAGIDVRRPCRDRRVVEAALEMPGHLSYRGGWTKRNLRIAMEGVLPEKVRLRVKPTSLLPLAARGMADREYNTLSRLLLREDAVWQEFICRDWMEEALPTAFEKDSIEALVPWHGVCMERWLSEHGFGWGNHVH